MAAIVNAATVGGGFGNQVNYARVTYDFAVDAGATGALDLFTAGSGGVVIVDARAVVKTTCTSAGSATVKWGEATDDDRFMNTTQGAVASLTANAVIVPPALEGTPNVIATPYYLPAAGKLTMTIGTAALTAGKIEFVIGYMKP
jgi:hypothetical protein